MFEGSFHPTTVLVRRADEAESSADPLTAEMIRHWMKDVNALSKSLQLYGDKESIQVLEAQRQRIGDVMDAIKDEGGPNVGDASRELKIEIHILSLT